MEEAERKYMDIMESERMQFRKKEQANKEIITEVTKRLKVLFIFIPLVFNK